MNNANGKGIVVVAYETHVQYMYCYIPYSVQCELMGVDDHGVIPSVADGQVQRRIQLAIGSDGRYSILSDYLCYGHVKLEDRNTIDKTYVTPDIAADEVGADMVELALSVACPEVYSKAMAEREELESKQHEDRILRG